MCFAGLKVGKHCLKSKFAMGKTIIKGGIAQCNGTDFDILANSTNKINYIRFIFFLYSTMFLISCYCLKIRVIFLSAPFQVNEVLLDTYSIDCSREVMPLVVMDFRVARKKKKKKKNPFPFKR